VNSSSLASTSARPASLRVDSLRSDSYSFRHFVVIPLPRTGIACNAYESVAFIPANPMPQKIAGFAISLLSDEIFADHRKC